MIDRGMTNNEIEKGKKEQWIGDVDVRAIPELRRFKSIQI
jgi:hypothetical protein